MNSEKHRALIRDIPDFPKLGILFKDITPLLQNSEAFRDVVETLARDMSRHPVEMIVGIESRGFLLASAVAYVLGCGLCLVRKPGKLPYKSLSQSYDLEYGSNSLEIHADALTEGQKVSIIDDVLATGGTALAAASLCEKLGAQVQSLVFMVELDFLNGRERLQPRLVHSLYRYS
ncbi:MAG: adenine phosphoribosyltransferase [Deltaproteobacteria bacterium CG11_big_fil_rev_8_21_14_0_20_45_16]|nr:MAG: adenine phosphoribosyltransferase [Deltaproteobacteria bacterium CG11_big_fil_rev_8_21_14_0_20_45_16]